MRFVFKASSRITKFHIYVKSNLNFKWTLVSSDSRVEVKTIFLIFSLSGAKCFSSTNPLKVSR